MQLVLMMIFLAVTVGAAAVFMIFCPGKGDLHDRRVRRMVCETVAAEMEEKAAPNILRKDIVDQSSSFRKRLKQLSHGAGVGKMLSQTGSSMDQTTFVLFSGLFALVGAGLGWLIFRSLIAPMIGFAVGALLPRFHVRRKAKKRSKLLTEQMPDALEMLVSALRSGQAFATGLSTVATEMPEPTAIEFQQAFDEQNYGVSMTEALDHMRDRVDSMDMEFFVTAVTIQRETGGNLAEVLDGLSKTIRGRLKLFGHIATLTAQGRMSGWIVACLPVGIAGMLYLLNPDYISLLFTRDVGKYMLGFAVFLQFCGIMMIRKIVNIKV